jgi:hypothetical protein
MMADECGYGGEISTFEYSDGAWTLESRLMEHVIDVGGTMMAHIIIAIASKGLRVLPDQPRCGLYLVFLKAERQKMLTSPNPSHQTATDSGKTGRAC